MLLACAATTRGDHASHKRVARVCLEKKTGAKAAEIIAIITVRSLVKTSLKTARDSADNADAGVSYLHIEIKIKHRSPPREKTSAGFFAFDD